MKISRVSWSSFILVALISIVIWFRYTYPQLAFLNFSVDRSRALSIAKDYLTSHGYAVSSYQTAILFRFDNDADRYLQKTVGFKGLTNYVHDHQLDMFYWMVRFFKEKQLEEFQLAVSSATGEVIFFNHKIEETAVRPEIKREEARENAKNFLHKSFAFNLEEYETAGDVETRRDYRKDYSLSWQKKAGQIPWGEGEHQGFGKLITRVNISGNEILSFSKNEFEIPEQFNRDLRAKDDVGQNLSLIVKVLYYILFVASIYVLLLRRNHLVMQTTKRFYIGVTVISFILSLLAIYNFLDDTLFHYPTTKPMSSYVLQLCVNSIISLIFITVAILMPSLSGELMHYENFKEKKEGAFLHNIISSFFTRSVTKSIILGYFTFLIMLGIQSTLIEIGQRYWGVWVEHNWLTMMTTAYLPFLAAFSLGYKASLSEELMFRLFAISWGKKFINNTLIIAVISSLIWGLAHTGYPVYPNWFRGVEVTSLGLFLSFVYLRFGLIAVVIGHYLFDVFWSTAGYMLGHTTPFYLANSLFVMFLPLIFALAAFLVNKPEEEKPLRWLLNKHQQYNLQVLKTFLAQNRDQLRNKSKEEITKEITAHGWDVAVVEVALEDITNEPR